MKMRIFCSLGLLVAAGLAWVAFGNNSPLNAKQYNGPPPQRPQQIDFAADLRKAPDHVSRFIKLDSQIPSIRKKAFADIEKNWKDGYRYQLMEVSRFVRPALRKQILGYLNEKTGKDFEAELDPWQNWSWNEEYIPADDFALFKRFLYRRLDPRFGAYFEHTENAKIRLDEVVWGGVKRDGIPPLKDPKMLAAGEADYLGDSNIVYGIMLNGDARCYPKRILAWHEMFKDTIGGESVAGVY